MQIHDLNTKALTDPAYVAFDDGTDTYKTEFNDVVADAAAAAVADADLTDNTVAFTSGDAASPTAWTAVDVLTSGLSLKTLFNRISTMVKNVRYIWNMLGSSSFSNVASTLTGAIGNTALTTTAQTLSGAIAEHESDISTLNSKMDEKSALLYITLSTSGTYSDSALYTALKNDSRVQPRVYQFFRAKFNYGDRFGFCYLYEATKEYGIVLVFHYISNPRFLDISNGVPSIKQWATS